MVYLFKPWVEVRIEDFRFRGKLVKKYHKIKLPNATMAIIENSKNEILITKEYRHGVGKEIFGLPGGIIDNNETPMQTIKRELWEETGIICNKWKYFHKFVRHCSYGCGLDYVYLANFKIKNKKKNSEISRYFWIGKKKLKEMIIKNKFINSGVGFSLSKYLL